MNIDVEKLRKKGLVEVQEFLPYDFEQGALQGEMNKFLLEKKGTIDILDIKYHGTESGEKTSALMIYKYL